MLRRIALIMLTLTALVCVSLAGVMQWGRFQGISVGYDGTGVAFRHGHWIGGEAFLLITVYSGSSRKIRPAAWKLGPLGVAQREVNDAYYPPLGRYRGHVREFYLTGAAWPLAMGLTLGALRAVLFIRARRHPVVLNGCKQCEYDLTGNESGRCPECGKGV